MTNTELVLQIVAELIDRGYDIEHDFDGDTIRAQVTGFIQSIEAIPSNELSTDLDDDRRLLRALGELV